MKKLMIIDGNSIFNRAFYGIGLLSNSEGLFTNAIYGFIAVLLKNLEEENPDYICVAFDMKAPTFRHKEYEGYKAKRSGMPDELAVQLPILKEVLSAMNIQTFEKEGYEADDIIGTVSLICEEKGIECIILTGDKDSLQLASQSTKIKLTTTRKGVTNTDEYKDTDVVKRYGVTPFQFIDVKGLMGDPSDNIPGVKGVGEKTALSLIKDFKSIENIYEKIEDLNIRETIKKKLKDHKDMAFLSRKLSEIDRNVPVDKDLTCCLREEYDREKLLELFNKLEFRSFIEKMQLEPVRVVEDEVYNYNFVIIDTKDRLNDFIEKIKNKQELFYYLVGEEETGEIQLLVFLLDKDTVYIDLKSGLNQKEVTDALKPIFDYGKFRKNGYNIKKDIVILNKLGIELRGIYFDIMIGAYILDPARTSYPIEGIISHYLKTNILSLDEILGKGKKRLSIEQADKNVIINYTCKIISALPKLAELFDKKIKEYGQEKLFYEIEMPLIEVLANMQINGFMVDEKMLTEFSEMLDGRINTLTKDIYFTSGVEFNINSPKQLGEVLFDRLKLPVIKKTKTGYSTNIDVLERLKGNHEIIDMLIEYRQLVKLKSTYADGLLSVINPNTGKIHSKFNQTVTVTGRISSTEPNMQNIPIKLDLGREIRKMFIASDDDYILVDADYSQIELRVLAHISNDPVMIQAFKNKVDIHTITAAQVFGVKENEVTPFMRSSAKAVNFGIVYGIGDFSLAQDIGTTKKEAKRYIDNYLSTYSGVKQYMEDIKETAKEKGYVTTLLNRRRYLPELQSSNFVVRSFGERVALNTPIQGTAADIIKIAMVNVYNEFKTRGLKSKLILQVHDDLIIEAHKSEVDEVKDIMKRIMEEALELNVPLTVDLNSGRSWYDTK